MSFSYNTTQGWVEEKFRADLKNIKIPFKFCRDELKGIKKIRGDNHPLKS